MAEVGSAFVSILPSAKGFGSKLNSEVGGELKGAGERLGSGFGKAFGLAAGALAGAATVNFLKDSISAASDLNEAGTKTQAIFGKAGTVMVNQFAAKGAAALGQTKLQVLDAAATFGTFGKAAGKTGPELAKFSSGLVGLSTDLASFFNTSPEEAAQAIAAGLRGEAEPLRQYGVLLDDATLRQEALRLGLVQTTKQALTPQQKVLAAQAAIYKQTKDAQGDFARTSGGLANQQRILSAQFGNLKATLGAALLPVVVKVVTGLNGMFTKVSPALHTFGGAVTGVVDKLSPAFDKVKGPLQQFGKGIGSSIDVIKSGDDVASGLGETLDFAFGNTGNLVGPFTTLAQTVMDFGGSIKTNFVPVLSTMGQTFTTTILPAISNLAGYLGTTLLPIFAQVGNIIATQVVPIVASLAQFFYGTLYPAVVKIVTQVAGSLQPVFSQLAATFQTQILPAIQRLLERFRQWQPTIQQVVMIVLTLVGWLLRLAAAVLGKVLPPLIRLAGWLIGKLFGAIGVVISILVGLVKGIIGVGKAFVAAVKFAAKFGDGVNKVIGKVLDWFGSLPGKIKNALSGAGSFLLDTGKDIVRGLINGIKSMGGQIKDTLVGLLPGPLKKFAGKLGIASPSKVFHRFGQNIGEGLRNGIDSTGKKVTDSVGRLADKVRKKLLDKMKTLEDHAQGLADTVSSIASNVAGAFRPDLFSGSLGNLMAGGGAAIGKLRAVLNAITTLRQQGASGAFLQQLMASGNSDLILALAGGPAATTQAAQAQFNEIQSLTSQIGGTVSQVSPEQAELVQVRHQIVLLRKELAKHPAQQGRATADALNHTAAAAKRRKKKVG